MTNVSWNAERRYDIELIRILSSFGIVYFHSQVNFGRQVAYAGLVCFVIISAWLSVSDKNVLLVDRAERLLLPFVFWYIIYAIIKIIKGNSVFPENYKIYSMILASPSIHLWYLPFIFLSLSLISLVRRSCDNSQIGLYAGGASIFLLMTSPFWRSFPYSPPFIEWIHATPALLIGIFLGYFNENDKKIGCLVIFLVLLTTSILAVKSISGI